jgi:hypothetical protein
LARSEDEAVGRRRNPRNISHVRNLLIASVVIAAGAYAIREQSEIWFFEVLNLTHSGIGVAAIAAGLVGLNILDGFYRLTKFGSSLALKIAFLGLYLFVSLRLIQLIVLFRAG